MSDEKKEGKADVLVPEFVPSPVVALDLRLGVAAIRKKLQLLRADFYLQLQS